MSALRERYAGLLRWYPAEWRDRNGTIMLDTLEEDATARGIESPGPREVWSLRVNGVAEHASPGAARAFALVALALGACSIVADAVRWWGPAVVVDESGATGVITPNGGWPWDASVPVAQTVQVVAGLTSELSAVLAQLALALAVVLLVRARTRVSATAMLVTAALWGLGIVGSATMKRVLLAADGVVSFGALHAAATGVLLCCTLVGSILLVHAARDAGAGFAAWVRSFALGMLATVPLGFAFVWPPTFVVGAVVVLVLAATSARDRVSMQGRRVVTVCSAVSASLCAPLGAIAILSSRFGPGFDSSVLQATATGVGLLGTIGLLTAIGIELHARVGWSAWIGVAVCALANGAAAAGYLVGELRLAGQALLVIAAVLGGLGAGGVVAVCLRGVLVGRVVTSAAVAFAVVLALTQGIFAVVVPMLASVAAIAMLVASIRSLRAERGSSVIA